MGSLASQGVAYSIYTLDFNSSTLLWVQKEYREGDFRPMNNQARAGP